MMSIDREMSMERRIADWKFWRIADAYEECGELQYAIKPLFALPSLNIIYGFSGSLKSLLLADAAICIAGNHDWLPSEDGKAGFAVRYGPAVWIDQDNGGWRTHEHFGALGRSYSVPEDAPLHYISMPNPPLNISAAEMVDELIELVSPIAPLMIGIDNLGTVSGGVDENSSQMINTMANLRRLAEQTGAAVVIIHHERKGDTTNQRSRAGNALRGHTSIEAALDLALRVERQAKRDVVKVVSTKERGPKVADFGAVFKFDHRPNTEDLYTARFYGCDPEASPKEHETLLAIRKLLAQGDVMGKTGFINAVHTSLSSSSRSPIGKELIKKVFDREVETGRIVLDVQEDSSHTQLVRPGPKTG